MGNLESLTPLIRRDPRLQFRWDPALETILHLRGDLAQVGGTSEKAIGAVRRAPSSGKIVIYVENAGDFVVPLSAVKDVYAEKVVLNPAMLSLELRQALGHAHDVEDPNV